MLSRRLVFLLAVSAAVAIANLYYSQPLLEQMANEVHAPRAQIGLLATLAQVGYGLGMLFLVPLGDMLERRRLIVALCVVVAIFLAMMGAAPTLPWMLAASLLIGVFTCAPQVMIPYAATLATPENRGRVVGNVMSGLLIGILLSRTVSGFVGAHAGFRAVYYGAAVVMLILAAVLRFSLEPQHPTQTLSYGALIKSLWGLLWREPVLRRHALLGALTFAGFSVFWTTLSFQLATPPLHYGGDVAGLYGLVGVAGALVAPLVGRLADKGGAARSNLISILACAVSFVILFFGGTSLVGLAIGVLLLDIGAQGNHVTNQARVFSLDPALRSRFNAVYMTLYFAGGAVGSALATQAFIQAGWHGVSLLGVAVSLASLLVFFTVAAPLKKATP
jgi:predicted MFS family arabinose efflux permease